MAVALKCDVVTQRVLTAQIWQRGHGSRWRWRRYNVTRMRTRWRHLTSKTDTYLHTVHIEASTYLRQYTFCDSATFATLHGSFLHARFSLDKLIGPTGCIIGTRESLVNVE